MSIIEQSEYIIIGYKLDDDAIVDQIEVLYRGDTAPKTLDFGGLQYYDEIALYKREAYLN